MSRVFLTTLFAFVFVPSLVYAADTSNRALYNQYLKAFIYTYNSDYQNALDAYTGILASSPSYHAEKDACILLLKNNQRVEARPRIAALLATHPDDYELLMGMTYCLLMESQFDPALEYLARARNIKPDGREALYYEGLLRERTNENEQALTAFKEYLAGDPHTLDVMRRVAEVLVKLQRMDEAAIYFQDIVALNPNDASVWWNLALINESLHPDATEYIDLCYRNALEHETDLERMCLILNKCGLRAYQQQDCASATLFFQKVVTLCHAQNKRAFEMQWVYAMTMLVSVACDQKNFAQAITYQKELVKKSPDDIAAVIQLAILYETQGNHRQALRVIHTAFKTFPYSNELHFLAGLVYEKLNKPKKAVRHFSQAITSAPYQQRAYLHLGMMYDELGEKDKAYETFNALLLMNPFHPDAARYVAQTLAEKKTDFARAENLAASAVQHFPENGSYRATLGFVYLREQKYADAAQLLHDAAYMTSDPVVFEHYSEALHALGNDKDAWSAYQCALFLDTKPSRVASHTAQFPSVPPEWKEASVRARIALFFSALSSATLSGHATINVHEGVSRKKYNVKGMLEYAYPDTTHLRLLEGTVDITNETVFRNAFDGTTHDINLPWIRHLPQWVLFPPLKIAALRFDTQEKDLYYYKEELNIAENKDVAPVTIAAGSDGYIHRITTHDTTVEYVDWHIPNTTSFLPLPHTIRITLIDGTIIVLKCAFE